MSWNQWPGAPAQQPPVVAAATPLLGATPSVMPPGMPYTSDQWTQMQQQNWQQWAQWQQQYQQWHQQYGAEYQKSINAFAAQQTVAPAIAAPPLPVDPQPPLPKEEIPKPAPPLPVPVPPPQQSATPSYSTQPQPLMQIQFSAPPPNFAASGAQQPWKGNANNDQKRALVGSDDSTSKRQMTGRQNWQNASAAPPPVANPNEELSEAEKKFDKQFAEWEAQFNKWKDQNSGHPDKQQYKEYEKKWEQWRQQLLDRREAMRRKRLGLPPAKPGSGQNFNAPPPSQAQNAQPPLPASTPAQAPSGAIAPKDAQISAPNLFSKPPPDMNNEPLQFKNIDKEPEVQEGLSFLNASKSEGIPGLDLVKEGDIEDIEDDTPVRKGPDLEAISKGINNILGDQKLMSMLSMVSQNPGSNLNNFPKLGDASSSRDQSNLSGEDSRNDHPEPIQNFDDQTRSSFTMQPNDSEYFKGNNSRQFVRGGGPPPPPPSNYHDNEAPYSRPPPNFTMPTQDDMNRPPPGMFGMDQAPFSQRNPGGFDRAPPAIQGRRGTGLLPDPDRPRGFGPGETGRNSFGPGDTGRNSFGPGEQGRNSFGPGRNSFGPGEPGRNSFGPGEAGRKSFGPGETGRNSFEPGRNTFGPGETGRNSFGPGETGRNSFGPGESNRSSFGPGEPGRNSFGPGEPGRNSFGPGEPGRNSFGPGNMNRGRESFGPDRNRDDFGPRGDFDRGPNSMRDGPASMNRDIMDRGGRADFEEETGGGYGGRPPFNRNFQDRNSFENSYDNEDYGDEREQFDEPEFERGGRPQQNQGFGQGAKEGRDNFNGPPPLNFRGSGGRDNFNEPPPPNFRGGRDDFNNAPPSNFNKRNNFRQDDDRSFQRAGNYENAPNDQFDRYQDERPPPNRGPGPDDGRFNRGGGRFDGDFRDDYGQGNFEDDRDYPPPPPVGGFGPGDNMGPIDDAPEPPRFGRENLEEAYDEMPPSDYVEPPPEEEIWKPVTVVDYEHKRVKPPEIDILVQPFRMFDYRHKLLRRIPYPDRPNWLSDAVKMIPEFDPPIIRQPTIDRRQFDDRFEPPPRRDDRYRPEERHRNPYDVRFSPPPPKFEENDWSSRRRRSRSPPRYERSPVGGDRFDRGRDAWDQGRLGERDKRGGNKRWEDEDRSRRERNFERRDDRRDRRDDRDRGEESWKRRDTEWEDREKKWRNDDMDIDKGDRDKNDSRFGTENRKDSRFGTENRNNERDTFARKDGGSIFPFSKPIDENKPSNITPIEDLLNAPGRSNRPQRIVIILRGPPGSGKTYLAKMIKDKEVENGGSAPRILSLDDYFMVEQEKEVIEEGRRVKLKEMVYEFEAGMEESYRNSLIRSFKKTITDGYFPFIIVDNVNDKVKYFGEMWSFAKQNGFQVYVCQLDLDIQICTKRNVHNRTEDDIRKCIEGWETTPSHHPILDVTSLLQGEPISEVEMEEINSVASDMDDKDDGLERDLMASANPPAPQELWKNTYSSMMSARLPDPPNPDRRGFDGPIWRNENNRRR